MDGPTEGDREGLTLGAKLGESLRITVGDIDEAVDGDSLSEYDGNWEGLKLGFIVGEVDGDILGLFEGSTDGD